MKLLPLLLALLAGCLIPFQTAFNARLGTALGNGVQATTVSFVIATLAMLLLLAATQTAVPTAAQAGAVPPLAWFGGVIGALYVTAVVWLAPRLGVASVTVLLIAGQVLAAMLIEHFGWLGAPHHPLSALRLGGVVLLAVGIWAMRQV
ncbi:MAG TPA: DMT family transporter [Hymenobacter sp.]|jgi:transporter family-2 protein